MNKKEDLPTLRLGLILNISYPYYIFNNLGFIFFKGRNEIYSKFILWENLSFLLFIDFGEHWTIKENFKRIVFITDASAKGGGGLTPHPLRNARFYSQKKRECLESSKAKECTIVFREVKVSF